MSEIDDIRLCVSSWALKNGVLDSNALDEIRDGSSIVDAHIPFDQEDAAFFQNRKILKIQSKKESLVIYTRLPIAKIKRDKLQKKFSDFFSDIGFDIKFSVLRPFKIDQKVQPSIQPIFWTDDNKIACGSSIGLGNQRNAGTFTAIGKKHDGGREIYVGISCNHVLGGCNTAHPGIPVVVPGIQDVSPENSDIFPIGSHDISSQMVQGLPSKSVDIKNNSDISCFQISDDKLEIVSSIQGEGDNSYDTPTVFANRISEKLKVKKWGRTTGFTRGRVLQVLKKPEPIPYDVTSFFGPTSSHKFKGVVYYQDVIEIQSNNGSDFSKAGDSGALVVTDTKPEKIVGILIGGSVGNNSKSYVLPIKAVLKKLQITLCSKNDRNESRIAVKKHKNQLP